jgi:two-component SAPR family response regulator
MIVEDEPLMLKRFVRLSAGIADLDIVGRFESAGNALSFAKSNPVDIAFLDVELPIKNGIALAKELREIRRDMIIVFVSAYDEYIWECKQIGGDYYILKPYSEETLSIAMEKIRLLALRQQKSLYVQTFGRFVVYRNGRPLALSGKAKEILAFIVTRRGKEVSNEEIYSTIWEDRPYGNVEMTVYYNALRRLKAFLKKEAISELLISTPRGQIVNTAMFDCDYYAWQDQNLSHRDRFEGEFLSEYSWAEYLLAEILNRE